MTVLEPGTTFAGKYLIDGVLGKGGMGAVYSATNQAIGRRVAIKVLVADLADREDVKTRFALEARAAAVINHPGIVDVLDMGETDDAEPFIVMEYLEGATLKAVFKKNGVFSPQEAVAVAMPLLDALAAAHQAAVIHRDIKPANIFLCTRPQRLVKLLDFGISRFGQSTGLTHSGTAVGTPKYMAPEQLLGEKTLGPAADLYSVGAVLYELLGGRAPYDADSDIATLAKLLQEAPPPLQSIRADLPARLCAFIDALLVKDPAQRASDAAEVKAELAALVKPGDLKALFDLAQESASRTSTGGTPRPPSGPARLPNTAPGGRRQSVTRMPVAQPPDDDAPSPRPSARRPSTKLPRPSPPTTKDTSPSLPEVTSRSPARTGLAVGVAVALLAVIVGAGLFVWLGRGEGERTRPVVVKGTPAPAKPSPPPVKAAPAPEIPGTVVVTLRAEPASTRFEVDGEKLSGNPVRVSRTADSRAAVIATAQGYEPRAFSLTFDATKEERVTLSRAGAAPEPRPTKAAPKPPPVKKGGKLTVDETNPYE